jgi:hypothetical protein
MKPWLAVLLCISTVAWADGEPPPVRLTFEVQSATKAALLSGDLAVQPNRPASMERRAASGPERQRLSLELRPLDDGTLFVRASWSDTTADGATVTWEPAFVVRRGADASVRLDYPGGARVLHLKAP